MLLLFSLSFISTAHSQIAGPVTCDTSSKGKMIYNFDHKMPQFCDGTEWISMATGYPRTDCAIGSDIEWDGSEWVCTVVPDTTPDAFSFTDETDVALSTIITSNSININGINTSTPVSVSGDGSPEIRINGGSWATSGSITDGQSLEVRLTSSGSNSTAHTATVDVGGVTDVWSVTTASACGGVEVGGYCWYYGGTNQSCTQVCSTRGGYNAATNTFAGRDGNNANCSAVASALGLSSTVTTLTSCFGPYGCMEAYGNTYRCTNGGATTAGGSDSFMRRICACNN